MVEREVVSDVDHVRVGIRVAVSDEVGVDTCDIVGVTGMVSENETLQLFDVTIEGVAVPEWERATVWLFDTVAERTEE